MDPSAIGSFIAELRRQQGLTQEQLGERIGVTNKTVSRWETGVYMPPADALMKMSELFGVTVNEILTGRRLTESEYKETAEENLKKVIRASSFNHRDRVEYFRRKWLKDHAAAMVIAGLCILAAFVLGLILRNSLLIAVTPLLAVAAHGLRHNAMMSYVEKHVYDDAEGA